MEGIEKQMLEDALQKARYNKTRAAELWGISFRSFRYKLKKFGIE
jgi:two-component system response regulator PilR (NtrC family)